MVVVELVEMHCRWEGLGTIAIYLLLRLPACVAFSYVCVSVFADFWLAFFFFF